MLLNSFYTVSPDVESSESRIIATLTFVRESPIFNGHFPQHPVVPGVCMFAMIKELLEQQLETDLQLVSCRNMKFLNMIDPDQTPHVDAEVNILKKGDDHLDIQARLYNRDFIYFHMSGATYHVKNKVNGSV